MRQKLYKIIEPSDQQDVSRIYDIVMIITIIASIVPLAFKQENQFFHLVDRVATILFVVDYLLRWLTADYKRNGKFESFVIYPFSFMAIIDLLSILPGVVAVNNSLKLFKLVRLVRMMRLFRITKAMRYSKNITIIASALSKQKDSLIAVCYIAGAYILISALVIFNVEPDSFDTFFDALYWALVTLTTVGYGDIYPRSSIGRVIAMISSLFGIAIVALPAGIITAGLMDELKDRKGGE